MENENKNAVTQTEQKNEGTVTQTVDKTEGKAEKTFTQEEVNAMVRKENAKILKKYEGVDLDAYKQWEESQKTAEQKQQEEIIKMQNLKNDNDFKTQMLEIMKKGLSYDEAEFVQFKLSKMNGDFEENLENYLKNNKTEEKEEKKTTTTGFSQNNTNKVVSEDKAYLDKKYANNPYYKK